MARLAYVRRAAGVVLRDPAEGADRLRNRLERVGQGDRAHPYRAEASWEEHLHALLGVAWPCAARAEFDPLWAGLVQRFAAAEIPLGQYNDADPAFARAVWCVASHLRPRAAVETGVARGVASSFLLRAFERTGEGRLWSIDLPPLQEVWHKHAAAAVVPELTERWTLLHGSSRRRLPRLLSELRHIDLFVHDSLHTARNMRFEFDLAWKALRPGGALIADDVQLNAALAEFLALNGDATAIVAEEEGKQGTLFAVVLKEAGSLPATPSG